MFAKSFVAASILALSVSAAGACGYKAQESAQTPLPPVAQAPVQTPVPAEPVVETTQASVVVPAPAQPKTN